MTITSDEWLSFEQLLRGYVSRRVGASYVSDLVGDILLRIASHESDFIQANNPTAWMYRVASNVIADHYRRRSVEQSIFKIADTPELEGITTYEEDLPPEKELSRCLLPLISKLPPLYREALQLVDIKGVSQSEAAQIVGISLSGMKSRVQRGRLKLKQLLLDCCTIEINKRREIVDYSNNSNCC